MGKSKPEEILIADDDEFVREILSDVLAEEGFVLVVAKDGNEAIRLMSDDVSVALLDLNMPGRSGIECVQFFRRKFPGLQSIMVTASTDIADAIAAMKSGAFDYLVKPVDPDRVLAVVNQALRVAKLNEENRQLKQAVGLPMPEVNLVGDSPAIQALLRIVDKVAGLDSTVLILGESGVGKGLLARMIHMVSNRAGGTFATVSCTSLPRELVEAELFGHEKGAYTGAHEKRPGRLEVANGGTVLLDEVGDMPLDLQPKLLNFLQERRFLRVGGTEEITVDIRVIAATNQNLKQMCQEKRFREDLYYRLNVIPVHIPPLRERKQDIPLLIDHFLEKIAGSRGTEAFSLTEKALDVMLEYSWPGNIRELENVLEGTTAFSDSPTIDAKDLPPDIRLGNVISDQLKPALGGLTLQEIEKLAILQTLETLGGNKVRAARSLGISEKSIYNKMKRLGLS